MTDINFLPDEYLKAKTRRRINAICLALLILVGAGVAGAFLVTEQRRHALNQRAARIEQEIDEARKSLQQLEQTQSRRKQISAKAQAAATLIETLPQSLVVALATNNLPEEMMITGYQMKTTTNKTSSDVKKSSKKRKSKKKKKQSSDQASAPLPQSTTKIAVTGLARDDSQVAEYVAKLNESRLLKRVDLRFCKEYDLDGVTMREFQVTGTLRKHTQIGDADVDHVRGLAQANNGGSQFLNKLFGTSK